MKVRTPRSTAAATELLARFAEIAAQVAAREAERQAAIAATNAAADAVVAPMAAELDAIEAALEPWWSTAAAALTGGKRKSIELGGCKLGTRSGKAKLTIAGDIDALVELMRTLKWAKPFLRTTVSIDRSAVLGGIDGKHAAGLAEIGFARDAGGETFFVARADSAEAKVSSR